MRMSYLCTTEKQKGKREKATVSNARNVGLRHVKRQPQTREATASEARNNGSRQAKHRLPTYEAPPPEARNARRSAISPPTHQKIFGRMVGGMKRITYLCGR